MIHTGPSMLFICLDRKRNALSSKTQDVISIIFVDGVCTILKLIHIIILLCVVRMAITCWWFPIFGSIFRRLRIIFLRNTRKVKQTISIGIDTYRQVYKFNNYVIKTIWGKNNAPVCFETFYQAASTSNQFIQIRLWVWYKKLTASLIRCVESIRMDTSDNYVTYLKAVRIFHFMARSDVRCRKKKTSFLRQFVLLKLTIPNIKIGISVELSGGFLPRPLFYLKIYHMISIWIISNNQLWIVNFDYGVNSLARHRHSIPPTLSLFPFLIPTEMLTCTIQFFSVSQIPLNDRRTFL